MTHAGRKQTPPELWMLCPKSRLDERRQTTKLVFQREAQTYLWRTNRSFLKIGKN